MQLTYTCICNVHGNNKYKFNLRPGVSKYPKIIYCTYSVVRTLFSNNTYDSYGISWPPFRRAFCFPHKVGSIWQLMMKWSLFGQPQPQPQPWALGRKGRCIMYVMYICYDMIWWCDGSYHMYVSARQFPAVQLSRAQSIVWYVVTDHCIIQVRDMIKRANIPYIPLSFFFFSSSFFFPLEFKIDIKIWWKF